MSTTPLKPFRVTFEERYTRHVDVLAVAAWQAIEIAQTLHDSGSSVVHANDDSVYSGDWQAEALPIGGAL